MRSLILICAGSLWLNAQTPEQSTALLLSRVRHNALENLSRQPNYTCLETVERWQRPGASRKFQLLDTLRLEVALVDGKEMFGWPGARQFEETDLRKIVSRGAIGNGNFALYARSIFGGDAATFQYHDGSPLDGRPSARFAFRVKGGFTITTAEKSAVVGFHGSFSADPKSFDLQQIQVIADDIPRELGIERSSDRIEYARVQIGDAQFLLPSASEMLVVDLKGQESRNLVRFASCRQFTGESVLTFSDAPADASNADASASRAVSVERVELPHNLVIRLALLDDIDTRSAAVGDPVRARLNNDLKHRGRLLVPKGAIATGRITRLERGDDVTILGLEFSQLESPGLEARLLAKLEEVAGSEFTARSGLTLTTPAPGEGIIPLFDNRHRLPHGTLMFWRTES